MLEKALKVVLALMLMVLYVQQVIVPGVQELRRDRQQLESLQVSVNRFRGGGGEQEQKRLQMQQAMIREHFLRLGQMIPGFDETRTNLQAKFEVIKKTVPGIWNIKPAPSFNDDEQVVRWPFKIVFDGAYAAAVQAMALIENSGQITRVNGMQLSTQPDGRVRMEADVELLYQRQAIGPVDPAKGGVKP